MEVASQYAKEYQFPLSDIAYHYVQAGDKEKSIEYSLVAGKHALARFCNAEAIKHFTYVLENMPKNMENPEQKMTALEGAGRRFLR
jgi:predicted ATPase